jgi:arsenate reductase (thioredoxin)
MKRVMFVCKKNSARSQMAEGFAKSFGNGIAIQVMQDVGIDISHQTSNALSEFQPTDFDVVISLCGCGVNLPTEWLTQAVFEDWQLDDPAEQPEIFPRVRDEVKERVEKLIRSILLLTV